MKKLSILGTRGIPAQHGGFETFAEHLSLYLIRNDWEVTVYCQDEGTGDTYEDDWDGVRLIHIPVKQSGASGTILFDWKSTLHAANEKNLILTLGYNTAVFCSLYRLKGITNLINMDGIEWKRDKWSFAERTWLFLNERAGCLLGNHLVADHPEIMEHIATRVGRKKITMIPYGSDSVLTADAAHLVQFGLEAGNYAIVIARPEPENSIFEIVSAFSKKQRSKKLVILGNFDKSNPAYSKRIFDAASDEVIFPGAVYEKTILQALRYYACLYIHGHQVGGTNPSLVEALGAGNPILAHANKFNRWVAGNVNHYFENAKECEKELDILLDNRNILSEMSASSRYLHDELFTWNSVLESYEELLNKYTKHPIF